MAEGIDTGAVTKCLVGTLGNAVDPDGPMAVFGKMNLHRERGSMGIRAVIFDDDQLMRQLLEAVCERRGYEVFTFQHPGMFPPLAANCCPCRLGIHCADVIISDLRMPYVNGFDFLEGLMRKGCRNQHYALMSGHWTEAAMSRAKQLGCKVFNKPFRIRDITQWLEEVEASIVPERELLNWNKMQSIINPTGAG